MDATISTDQKSQQLLKLYEQVAKIDTIISMSKSKRIGEIESNTIPLKRAFLFNIELKTTTKMLAKTVDNSQTNVHI